MLHAQYLKGTEDRKTSVFLPDLPWYLPVGADGRLAELQAEAFHGAVPVPPRLLPAFRPGIQSALPSPTNWKQNHNLYCSTKLLFFLVAILLFFRYDSDTYTSWGRQNHLFFIFGGKFYGNYCARFYEHDRSQRY